MRGTLSKDSARSKIEALTTIDTAFRFHSPLKKFWSFGLSFDQTGFGLIIKMINFPKWRRIQNPVKHLR